jgi:hypothetical protein
MEVPLASVGGMLCTADPGGFGVNQHQSCEPCYYAEVGLENFTTC